MKKLIICLMVIAFLSCQEKFPDTTAPGDFSIKLTENQDYDIVKRNDSIYINLDTIKESKLYELILSNSGEYIIIDVRGNSETPNFYVYVDAVFALSSKDTSRFANQKFIISIIHEPGYDKWEPLMFLNMGENIGKLQLSGKTNKFGEEVVVQSTLVIKVFAEILAASFSQGGVVFDKPSFYSDGWGENIFGKNNSICGYKYNQNNPVFMKNIGNVKIHLSLYKTNSIPDAFQEAILNPNDSIKLELPTEYIYNDYDVLLKMDAGGATFNYKERFTRGIDGCAYALFAINPN